MLQIKSKIMSGFFSVFAFWEYSQNKLIRGYFDFAFLIADKIMATLGEGTFGRVVKVKDMQMYVKLAELSYLKTN